MVAFFQLDWKKKYYGSQMAQYFNMDQYEKKHNGLALKWIFYIIKHYSYISYLYNTSLISDLKIVANAGPWTDIFLWCYQVTLHLKLR